MATKLNAANAKRVKALRIKAKNEEEAREKLLEILVENGIEGMEDEDTDTLLDIAESFVDEDTSMEEELTEEEEADELADEVEEEEAEEEEETEEEEAEEGDELDEKDRSELKAFIKSEKLGISVKKSMTDDDIREAIRTKLEEMDTEEEEEIEEEVKPAPKKEVEKKPAPKKAVGKRGVKLDPKNNEEDRKEFEPLKNIFPDENFVYSWVASNGVTIKYKGKNSQRAMVLIENCSKQADDTVKCNLYLLTFTKQTDILDEAGIDYTPCWSGAPLIKGVTLDEAIEIISEVMEHITELVQKIDTRLGQNRKKMEENLDKSKKPAPKKKTKTEEEETGEEVKPAPKKKTKKTVNKK